MTFFFKLTQIRYFLQNHDQIAVYIQKIKIHKTRQELSLTLAFKISPVGKELVFIHVCLFVCWLAELHIKNSQMLGGRGRVQALRFGFDQGKDPRLFFPLSFNPLSVSLGFCQPDCTWGWSGSDC